MTFFFFGHITHFTCVKAFCNFVVCVKQRNNSILSHVQLLHAKKYKLIPQLSLANKSEKKKKNVQPTKS